jgi:hypothetical protein
MGIPTTIRLKSKTAAVVAMEFDSNGLPINFIGPLAFAGDDIEVATIDSKTGKITPVAQGIVNFSVKDTGVLDSTGNPLEDVIQVTVVP